MTEKLQQKLTGFKKISKTEILKLPQQIKKVYFSTKALARPPTTVTVFEGDGNCIT
jgi:hypothetical protein